MELENANVEYLYHYTSVDSLALILKNRTIRLNPLDKMDDLQEKKTKDIENKKIKTVLRFGISGVLVCLWAWHFVYINLYPISLAYYEYSHNSVEEKIGVINSIEQDGKDRINLIIDNTEYTMVYSSLNSDDIISRDIDEGDTVKIEFGVKSKYIFDICELNISP